ncbi:hypothetical protein FVEG_12083 [Fusarium verticillioides 7600]|uniref:Uncharacterized protein n=1 Tax=Gibberella moniliformis (strain M3125 / FGSC 7600) TaxID=334819 RepID=W7N0N7_GIBM7|nr:hypothetical protein FVEG_12083 [Fusarium verticillioides 7600]EWG53709.1 hypothetical protein FVEG_12083 [Fusarium verticillioides 7600]
MSPESWAWFYLQPDRANVGTSRVRRGTYILGNSQTLVRDEISDAYSTWRKVIDVFERRQCIDVMLSGRRCTLNVVDDINVASGKSGYLVVDENTGDKHFVTFRPSKRGATVVVGEK